MYQKLVRRICLGNRPGWCEEDRLGLVGTRLRQSGPAQGGEPQADGLRLREVQRGVREPASCRSSTDQSTSPRLWLATRARAVPISLKFSRAKPTTRSIESLRYTSPDKEAMQQFFSAEPYNTIKAEFFESSVASTTLIAEYSRET